MLWFCVLWGSMVLCVPAGGVGGLGVVRSPASCLVDMEEDIVHWFLLLSELEAPSSRSLGLWDVLWKSSSLL
ncbi:hypothetical protein BDQ17DRAFT_1373266 [Cyathus striatus]|nr:hypothetical protein BDQ17DRAFT_1373266 [Cyathus striatus]